MYEAFGRGIFGVLSPFLSQGKPLAEATVPSAVDPGLQLPYKNFL